MLHSVHPHQDFVSNFVADKIYPLPSRERIEEFLVLYIE
jgi:hypothetical protein